MLRRQKERSYPMAKRKQNKITFSTILILLLFFGLYLLLDSAGALGGSPISHPKGTVQVHFIDVGQGDAIYIRTPSQDILIDAGERGDTVLDYLRNQKVDDLELVIGTHPHSDHIGGLIDVLGEIPTKEIVDPGIVHTSKTYEDYLRQIDAKNIRFTEGRAGMKRTFEDGVVLEILSPVSPDEDDLNESSVVTRLTYGKISFLFAGDAGIQSEKEMLKGGPSLRSTVLKVGHHGSSTGTGDDFLKAVAPKAAVILCGAGNSYGHPHKEILEKLKAADIDIYRTDIMGTIVMETDGSTYKVIRER